LQARRAPGRPPRLTPRQRARLLTLLLRGAMAQGYRMELWTTQRIAEVIAEHFGVHYHRDHVGRLMASLGWSYHKSELRTRERDEAPIARWNRTAWPRRKTTPRGWGAHLVCVAASGFLLVPLVHLERFPAYAPELNPDEGVWTLAKAIVANGRPDDFDTFVIHVHEADTRIGHFQTNLRGCVLQSNPLF